MMLSIIIVNWKSKDFLQTCLTSVYAQTRGVAFEVIVIDSGSFDGCAEMLRERFPQVRFIQSADNLGFAKANNLATRSARGDVLLFLNPDTELPGPAIQTLLAALESLPDAGAVGAKLLNTDGTIQTSCIQSFPTILNQVLDAEVLRRRFPRSRLWGMAALFATNERPQPVEAVSGACVLVRRAAFEEVGGFSEEYFMYGEDLDLSHKLRAAGLVNYFVPAAGLVHHGGSSTAQAPSDFSVVMMRESVWRFLRKTRGRSYAAGYRLALGMAACVRLVLLVGRPAARKWRAILKWSLGQAHSGPVKAEPACAALPVSST
jgi:hypothetical protein